jgi:hypothetical protein
MAKLPGSKAGTIVGVGKMAAALKDAWIIFESVPEDLELKKDIFRQVDALSDPDAILASNSSSYASSAFADSVKDPTRLLNTHFLMPPDITPVELMSCGQTDPAVIQLLVDLFPGYGLTPYVVERESMGFIFNRVWAAIKRETLAGRRGRRIAGGGGCHLLSGHRDEARPLSPHGRGGLGRGAEHRRQLCPAPARPARGAAHLAEEDDRRGPPRREEWSRIL